MQSPSRGALALAFPVIALAPDAAEACPYYYDPCAEGGPDAAGWAELAIPTDTIPADGVLVLRGKYVGDDPADSLANITLEVTRDGQPIAGALEATLDPGTLIWRPDAPWVPAGEYTITGKVTNPVPIPNCTFDEIPLDGAATIDAMPAPPLTAPTFVATPNLSVFDILKLETLACCDDAKTPTNFWNGCGGYYVDFDPAKCQSLQTHGTFSLIADGAPAAPFPASEQVIYTLRRDGAAVSTSATPGATFDGLTAPLCVSFDATYLPTGAVTKGPEQCFGEDFKAMLGDQPVAPTLECALEQCDLTEDGMAWDPNNCTPLAPVEPTPTTGDDSSGSGSDEGESDTDPDQTGDGDKACGCRETPPTTALLAVTALLIPRRRRSRSNDGRRMP